MGPVGGKKNDVTNVARFEPGTCAHVRPPSAERITPFCIVPTRMWHELVGSHAIVVTNGAEFIDP